MNRVLIWLASGDLEKLRPGILWGVIALENGWVDDLHFVVFGEAERILPTDDELFSKVLEAPGTLFCKSVADGMGVSDALRAKGAAVDYVGIPIADHLKDGWQVLVF